MLKFFRTKKIGWLRHSNRLPAGFITALTTQICITQGANKSATQDLRDMGKD